MAHRECGALISRIAVISSRFVRDAQVFQGSPEALEESEDIVEAWEKHGYIDIGATDLFAGIFDGISEDEIKRLVVAEWGVHPDAVQLIERIHTCIDDEWTSGLHAQDH